jgi:hypothetical protein
VNESINEFIMGRLSLNESKCVPFRLRRLLVLNADEEDGDDDDDDDDEDDEDGDEGGGDSNIRS